MPDTTTNYRTRVPQSADFQSHQDTAEDSNITNMFQPEEWEGHEEDARVANPFHDIYEEGTRPRLHQSPASGPPSRPPSTNSSNYSTKSHPDLSCLPPSSLHSPTPSYKSRDRQENARSTQSATFSHYPTNHMLPPISPSPSYKSRDPIPNTISNSTSITNSTNRIIRLPPRGVSHFNPATNKNWLPILQSFLSYTFTNPDILEEALETPKNGVTCVGKSMRICLDGNEGLAKLGETAIRLVMREQFYLFSIPEVQASQILNRVLSRTSLSAYPTIASCIRPQPSVPISFRNIIELVKEDTREDNTRVVSRAVKAVIGAVYLDGGIESAKKIMENLQMGIKLPPGSRR
ncbi:uncharacterized protein EAE98_001174 [Botrytis deweyae]|uniref:RNase III domain-containing protein n=1 Tax=Botrytis deweyae TaxID=2478750 RepID=A0ABQ7J0R8_9HELO|nr:uncharacterized protein EAE98_001174 [Botrytis deweyae]KAF7938836.1 hypothetical protein EAE98_001174 [Botrytis deweyae]